MRLNINNENTSVTLLYAYKFNKYTYPAMHILSF